MNLSDISGFLPTWEKSVKLVSQGKLSDNTIDSGLCILIYAANLGQSPGLVFTDSGIDNLIQKLIQANRDHSLTTKMRYEITSLMVALSEKFLAVHSVETMLFYPSLFDSIEGNSSNSGYYSEHEMSTTNDTYDDSAWTLKRKRKSDAMSDESLFHSSKDDSSNSGYSSINQISTYNEVTALKHKRKDDAMCGEFKFDDTLNYISTDTVSQESSIDKKNNSKVSLEMGDEDNESESRGGQHLKGQFSK